MLYNNELFSSCGRDKVVILWDLHSRKQLKTIALYDTLETMIILPKLFYFNGLQHKSDGICIVTGGENGNYCLYFKSYLLLIIKNI